MAAWVCRVCRWSLVSPARPSRSTISSIPPLVVRTRPFHTSSNLSLLLKNYMIPTIRVEKDVQAVTKSLERKVGLAPMFYQNAPVVLDFEASEGELESNNVVTLFNDIHKLKLIPVGITYTNDPIIQGLAKQYNIPFINSSRATSSRTFAKDESSSPSPLPPSSHSPNSLSSPQPEKMIIRSFSNSISSYSQPSSQPIPPQPFHNPPPPTHDPSSNPIPAPSPPIQLATSPGPPPLLHPPQPSPASLSPSTLPQSSSSLPPSSSPLPASSTTQNSHPTVSTETNNEGVPPLIIKSSLRSGQQVYARNGADLIIMGSVHSGAEALADGNIHIYGALKGRALAGVSGNPEAKIFSGKFHAELISIADTYCACEEQPPGTDPNKPSVVWLEQGNLKFSTMD